jgi:hypothetical protein
VINPSAQQQQQLLNVHGGKRLQVHAKKTSTMIYTRPLCSICNKPPMGFGECFSAGKKDIIYPFAKSGVIKGSSSIATHTVVWTPNMIVIQKAVNHDME